MNAAEYRAHRIEEIDGQLRLRRYCGMRRTARCLPDDIASEKYTEIAKVAVEREAAILLAMGVRRLAPGEGPQPVRQS